jgi:hypothetical protein
MNGGVQEPVETVYSQAYEALMKNYNLADQQERNLKAPVAKAADA